jgi:hypothetical protein
MKTKYEQSSDFSGAEIYNFLKSASSVPDYVQDAPVDDSETLQTLPKEAFADSGRKTYPINTPARTFVSNVYFVQKRAGLEKLHGKGYVERLEAKIKQAADIFGISPDLVAYSAELNQKQASDYQLKYASATDLDGTVLELFPYKTAADLTLAAQQFATNTQSFPMVARAKIAEDLVKASKEMGIDEIPDLVAKYASMCFSTPEIVKAELRRRQPRLKTAEAKDLYLGELSKLASQIDSNEDVMKIAEVCFYTEKNQGLWDHPDTARFLGDPVDRFFTITAEKVAQLTDVIEAGGQNYRVTDLQKVSAEHYRQAFGIEVDPMDKQALADLMPTMPRSDVALLRELSGLKSI